MHSIQKHLSAYRNEIKGVAILWVILFHAQLGLSGVAYEIQKIGYGGVDIFLFLSGYGLCRSLSANSDLRGYLKRRAVRLLPAYLPFCLIWMAVMLPLYGGGAATSLRIIAGNLTMLGFFADVPLMINWYVSVLALTIVLAPVFYACLRTENHRLLKAALLTGVLVLLGLAYVGNDQYMAVSRLPVFVLGMLFAFPRKQERNCTALKCCMGGAFVLGLAVLYFCFSRYPELLNDYAMYWHPFVLIAPAMCVGLGWLCSCCPSRLLAPLRALGKASFEIFLFNVWLEVLGKKYGLAQTPLQWILWSAAAVCAAMAYHVIIHKIVQKMVDKKA